jgi:Mg2+/Co2+ transporter CorB
MDILSLVTIAVCILISAFFAGAETAITGVSRARLYHLIQAGDPRAQIIGQLREKKESLISALLFGNNAVNILASALATNLAIDWAGDEGVIYATVVMTVLVVVFGEVLPKTIAIGNIEPAALAVSRPLWWIFKILYPVTHAIQWLIRPLVAFFHRMKHEGADVSASEIIRGTVELHHDEGRVARQERDMLGTILDLDDITVAEVMTHRINMESIDIGQPVEDIINAVIASAHTRMPVWEGRTENIVGVLYVKSLLKEIREKKQLSHQHLHSLLVRPWFIPDTTTLKEQLQAFRQRRLHLALVVDEYGELKGVVTLEDILEEIVGAINDEYDWSLSGNVIPMGHNVFQVEGTTTIRDLNRQLGWDLPDENASTIAGLIIDEARVIPDMGDSFEFHGVRFTVRGKSGNQLTRIWVEKLPEPEGEEAMGE